MGKHKAQDKESAYAEKLLDPRWQKKRLEILERDGWQCQYCGDTKTTLHVHHHFYDKTGDPWEMASHLLVTLCAPCHEYEPLHRAQAEATLFGRLRAAHVSAQILQGLSEALTTWGLEPPTGHERFQLCKAIAFLLCDREMWTLFATMLLRRQRYREFRRQNPDRTQLGGLMFTKEEKKGIQQELRVIAEAYGVSPYYLALLAGEQAGRLPRLLEDDPPLC